MKGMRLALEENVLYCPTGTDDWLDMIDELRVVFGRDVDLLSSRALRNPYRRQQILSAREVLFAA